MNNLFVWPVAGASDAEAPATIRAACSRVGHDLMIIPDLETRFPDLTWYIKDRSDQLVPDTFWIVGLGEGRRQTFGSGIDVGLDDNHIVVSVAEAVQDHLSGYEFLQWPQCPAHRHLMEPKAIGAGAAWTCRVDGRRIVDIGDLHAHPFHVERRQP